MSKIVLANTGEDDLGVIPFNGPIRFKVNGEDWYSDGAMALKSKYLKIDDGLEIRDAGPPSNFITGYNQYTRLQLVGFDHGRFVFRGVTKDRIFPVVIQPVFMAIIYAISPQCELYAKNETDPVTIEAYIETEVSHDCDCEFCHEEFVMEKKKHLIGVVMPIVKNYSVGELKKLEAMTMEGGVNV